MKKRTIQSYTLEFKQSSAKLAAESDQSVSQTAKDLGVHETTLYGWINKFHLKQSNCNSPDNPAAQELKQLRKENARLKQERDILKKAAAYFASEM
jgi:transposase